MWWKVILWKKFKLKSLDLYSQLPFMTVFYHRAIPPCLFFHSSWVQISLALPAPRRIYYGIENCDCCRPDGFNTCEGMSELRQTVRSNVGADWVSVLEITTKRGTMLGNGCVEWETEAITVNLEPGCQLRFVQQLVTDCKLRGDGNGDDDELSVSITLWLVCSLIRFLSLVTFWQLL